MTRTPLLAALCAASLVLGCAGGIMSPASAPPRSAQYDLSIDWVYPLNPKINTILSTNPLELGHVITTDTTTYVGSSLAKIVAIDNAKALSIWEYNASAPVSAGPVIHGSFLYAALSDGAILKLNAKTGQLVWKYDTTVPIEHSLTVTDDVVAVVNANNRLFVLNAADGTLKWYREKPRATEFTMYGQAAPLIENNILYAGYTDGYLVAYGLQNGTIIWTRDLAPNARFKDLDVQPVIVNNILYAANSSGGIYALDVNDGRTLWQRDIRGASSLIPYQNSLYISSQSGIFRLDRETGNTIWQNEIQKDALISPIQLGKKSIYASVQRLGLIVLDRVSGQTQHVIDLGTDFTSAPSLSNSTLTAISNRSTIYRFIVDDQPIR